jgi:hypothetical protein
LVKNARRARHSACVRARARATRRSDRATECAVEG